MLSVSMRSEDVNTGNFPGWNGTSLSENGIYKQ